MSDPSDDRGDQCVVFFVLTFYDFIFFFFFIRILSNDVSFAFFLQNQDTSLVIKEMIT